MKMHFHKIIFASFVFSTLLILSACKSKDPSIMKVFVRDESNELLYKAKVIIIGDTKSNPPTIDYVDTLFTDNLGVAEFNMDDFFVQSGESVKTGYFDILVKYLNKQATGRLRIKKNITSVETVRFEP